MQIGIAELKTMLYWKQVYDEEVQRLINITRYWRSDEKSKDDRKRYRGASRFYPTPYHGTKTSPDVIPF